MAAASGITWCFTEPLLHLGRLRAPDCDDNWREIPL